MGGFAAKLDRLVVMDLVLFSDLSPAAAMLHPNGSHLHSTVGQWRSDLTM